MKKVLLLLILLFSYSLYSEQRIFYLDKVIEDFEKNPQWVAESTDKSALLDITTVIMQGCSVDLKSEQPEQNYILGIKVHQNKIGEYTIAVRPNEPVYIGSGLLKFSYWTHGYNDNHFIKISLLDKNLEPLPDWLWDSREKLNFFGWREIIYNISRFLQLEEIYFNGFIIAINPLESITDNYFYFDFIYMEYMEYE